eukprot:TRINITY_DN7295_c0_g1_i10.p1 TRINITY_DN7295_c0_g1~~TRINITY_DN7295_c0_g1_i10.p1  ORF type:complete len:143 (-),score=16.34 TRINITY_DN7295_c0_g1_i10:35-463(-)
MSYLRPCPLRSPPRPFRLLTPQNWDKVYDEFISLSSPRIAKHGTFTNRIDIPRYSNSRGNTQEMDSGIVEIPEGGFFTVMPVPGASQEEEDSNGERRQPLLHLSPVNLPFRNLLSLFGFDGFLLNIRPVSYTHLTLPTIYSV